VLSVTFTPAGDDARSLNLNNRNARDLLALLGYEPIDGELWGEATPADLIARIGAARAVIATTGRRATTGNVTTLRPVDPAIAPTMDGRFYEGGRHAGYLDQRLDDPTELATTATALGGTVSWG
jgi:hypothetical protein